jgi:hypothetical protein
MGIEVKYDAWVHLFTLRDFSLAQTDVHRICLLIIFEFHRDTPYLLI